MLISRHAGYAKDWRLEEVREIQNKARTSGIPSVMDPRADEELISKAMAGWKEPLQDFLDQVNNHLDGHIEQLIAQAFQDWSQTALYAAVQETVSDYLRQILSWHGDNALRFLESEFYKPLTFDEEILEYRRHKELETIASQRRSFRAKALLTYRESFTGKQSVGPERLKKLNALQEGELGPDPFKDQVETMARVRAYYTSAASIMVEAIAKMQNFEIFGRCQQELGRALENGLGISGRDGKPIEIGIIHYRLLSRCRSRKLQTFAGRRSGTRGCPGEVGEREKPAVGGESAPRKNAQVLNIGKRANRGFGSYVLAIG